MQQYKKPIGTFKKPYQQNQPRAPTNYEDDNEPDPECLDEKETEEKLEDDIFFNRVIPNEQEIRARMSKQVGHIAFEDIEDALDELIQKQMKELG